VIQKRIFHRDGKLKTLFDFKSDFKIEYDEKGEIISKSKLSDKK
jgi:hypothetical protein